MVNKTESWKGATNSSQCVILTIGIPASGKDTWAREECESNPDTYIVVNRDVLRAKLYTESGSIHDYRYSKQKERDITEKQLEASQTWIDGGGSVIVSDTNLNSSTRQTWLRFADNNGIPLHFKVMDTPLHVCIKRNSKRADYVPESVLIRMETKMREYLGKYVHDKNKLSGKSECVIVDIDGTLADMKGIRGSYEWEKVGQDREREFVCDYVRSLYDSTYVIIFSGRDSVCREQTEDWLIRHNINYDFLYMREEGSNENDSIVKEEMFNKYVKDKFNVSHVIDDRKSVCQLWESMGFNVMNVGGFTADF